MSMKSGFVLIVGKVIDLVPDNFTGKDGAEVTKLSVLIKPSEEGSPIECECWGDTADKFKQDELVLQHIVVTGKLVGREWDYQGKTCRRVSVRIMEWENLGLITEVNPALEQASIDRIANDSF